MPRFRVLGPVELERSGEPVEIAAAKERTLLAVLLANANAVVSPDRLIDELWPDSPPRTARKTLQTYISHLRRHVADALDTLPSGYRLAIAAGDLDADVFEQDVADARLALLRSDFHAAATRFTEALSAWRGSAYDGVSSSPSIVADARRLSELRLSAEEDLLEARLESGDARDVIAELEFAVAREPFRERLWGLLMVALQKGGRQVEALRAFQRARRYLREELGVEPSAELRAVEARILQGDDAPDAVPPSRYVSNRDGLKIAYRSIGSGARPIVFCTEVLLTLELAWEIDEVRAFLDALRQDRWLVGVQRRGTGSSERDSGTVLAPVEDCVDDIDAVLDELGVKVADLVGWGHGGQVALAYAALRPQRVRAVAVLNAYARQSAAADYPVGVPRALLDAFSDSVAESWGTHRPLRPIFDPAIAYDDAVIRRVARTERLVASPRAAAEMRTALNDVDIRPHLDAVNCPVLVVGLSGSVVTPAMSVWLAEHLRNATYIERPGYFVPSAPDARAIGEEMHAYFDSL